MVQSARSLAARAMLAAALMIGFYLLALGVALGLLYVPYAEWTLRHGVTGKLALFCVVGAGLILWAIVPRPDRFAPPGPLLSPRGQYPLLRLVREVAAATGQAMPAEVYLVPDVHRSGRKFNVDEADRVSGRHRARLGRASRPAVMGENHPFNG